MNFSAHHANTTPLMLLNISHTICCGERWEFSVNKHINLIKLSVGTESVEGLDAWQQMRAAATDGLSRHVTRMWPKRELKSRKVVRSIG